MRRSASCATSWAATRPDLAENVAGTEPHRAVVEMDFDRPRGDEVDCVPSVAAPDDPLARQGEAGPKEAAQIPAAGGRQGGQEGHAGDQRLRIKAEIEPRQALHGPPAGPQIGLEVAE